MISTISEVTHSDHAANVSYSRAAIVVATSWNFTRALLVPFVRMMLNLDVKEIEPLACRGLGSRVFGLARSGDRRSTNRKFFLAEDRRPLEPSNRSKIRTR